MSTERTYVVDRIEGDTVVLIDDDERHVDAPADRFQIPLREGLVLVVPIGDKDRPQWGKAEADERAAAARRAEAAERLRRLRNGR